MCLDLTCPKGFLALKRDCGHPQAVPILCKSPLCAECERKRAHRLQTRWTATLKTLPALKLFTLTIQNGQDLAERLQVLDKAFRSLLDFRIGRTNRKKLARLVEARIAELVGQGSITEETANKWRQSTTRWLAMVARAEEKRGKSFKLRKLLKGLSSLEITYNLETETWHAHRHLIVSMSYVPQIVLSELWNHATAGKGQIVDIRAIYDVETGVTEALKYVTKGWEIPTKRTTEDKPSPAEELIAALKGKKRTWVLGRIRPQDEQPRPCPGCNKTDCDCEKLAVVTKNAELEQPNTFFATNAKEPSAPPVKLVIYKDEQGRRVWKTETLTEADLSLYRTKYQEKEARGRANAPPTKRDPLKRGGLTITLPESAKNSNGNRQTEGAAQLELV